MGMKYEITIEKSSEIKVQSLPLPLRILLTQRKITQGNSQIYLR